MRTHTLAFIALSTTSLLMSACSPMNSEFSCNATASDSCMTIEQVDAMTRYADGERFHGHSSRDPRGRGEVNRYERAHPSGAKVWVAPHPMNQQGR